MGKLGEPKAVLKVRKEDLPLLKEVLDSAKSKFKEVRSQRAPTQPLPLHLPCAAPACNIMIA
jgi:hypothetical protein